MDLEHKTYLKNLDKQEIEAWVKELGLDLFRAHQIRHWLFKKNALSFNEMTNLSKDVRLLLRKNARINHLEEVKTQVSKDGTKKYLFKLFDGNLIESVLIPEREHFTLCISSQVGCAMDCRFCVTGKEGFKRNLNSAEIIDQVIHSKRFLTDPDRLSNIVLMGMGEPLANYPAVLRAITTLLADDGMNFSSRKVTLSTCGIAPQIRKLGRDTTVNLAVSLNAPDNEIRNFLMPINKTYPLKELLAACKVFLLPNRRMITFEYILIKGVNDQDKHAHKLAKLLSNIRAKINLIPMNPGPIKEMNSPSKERILHFQNILIDYHYTVMIRKSKGKDIRAACGQLRSEGETDPASIGK